MGDTGNYSLPGGSMADMVKEKRERARIISDKIDRENTGTRKSHGAVTVLFVLAIILGLLASSVKSADKYIFVDTTKDGKAIFKKAPDYEALKDHYLKVVSTCMEVLQSDSFSLLDESKVIYNVGTITLQCIYANRLPEGNRVRITPFNMISRFTDDPELRFKLITLVSNSLWLRQDSALIALRDGRQFRLVGGQWYYISNHETRPVTYEEIICLVMGVKYTPPEAVESMNVSATAQASGESGNSRPPGLCTVEP